MIHYSLLLFISIVLGCNWKLSTATTLVNHPLMLFHIISHSQNALPLSLMFPLLCLHSALQTLSLHSIIGFLHSTELVSIRTSHICHHRMLITTNPFTSWKAGVNTPGVREYLYPLVPNSFSVFCTAQYVRAVCRQYLPVSCPAVCVAPPANPLPASAEMRALLKQSSQLTFLVPGAPLALLQTLPLLNSTMTKKLCRNLTGHETSEYDWLQRGMWGDLFFFPENPKSACVFVCGKRKDTDDTVQDELGRSAVRTAHASQTLPIWCDTQWFRLICERARGSCSWTGRGTVREACRLTCTTSETSQP